MSPAHEYTHEKLEEALEEVEDLREEVARLKEDKEDLQLEIDRLSAELRVGSGIQVRQWDAPAFEPTITY